MSESKESLQKRIKSPVFWSALIAQILALLVFTNVIDLNVSAIINNVVCSVLEGFVAFGLLNNPTNGDGL